MPYDLAALIESVETHCCQDQSGVPDGVAEALRDLATRQAQTCGTCQHWADGSDGMQPDCGRVTEEGPHIIEMPVDGSGYCQCWQAKGVTLRYADPNAPIERRNFTNSGPAPKDPQ